MMKKFKMGMFFFSGILLVLITLFLFLNNKDKKNTKLNIKENEIQEGEGMTNQKIKLSINHHELTATLNDNSSTRALVERLKKEPITIHMSDYANMEKVGPLGVSLPKNDEDITTGSGDLILYQGDHFVIYYDTNHWSLTRLGKIDNIGSQELKNILGDGDVTVILSLSE